jgi:AcrR family transcriptional regulator
LQLRRHGNTVAIFVARPIRLTRAERKAQTRTDLLRAANRLFLRNGYVATAVEDIATEAGVTTGAVYSNFATKEDLFLALIDELPNPDSPWISEDTTAPDDLSEAIGRTPEERAERWGRAVSRIRPDRREVALVMEMNAAALRSDRSRSRVLEHNRAWFQDLGLRLVDLFGGRTEDAEYLGIMAQSIYSGLTTHAALSGEPLPEEHYVRAYRLLAVLANDAAADR